MLKLLQSMIDNLPATLKGMPIAGLRQTGKHRLICLFLEDADGQLQKNGVCETVPNERNLKRKTQDLHSESMGTLTDFCLNSVGGHSARPNLFCSAHVQEARRFAGLPCCFGSTLDAQRAKALRTGSRPCIAIEVNVQINKQPTH